MAVQAKRSLIRPWKVERDLTYTSFRRNKDWSLNPFNYKTEPLPGKFPFPGLGPFSLLGESNFNYYCKMMFKWVYWNLMLEGHELPLENQMTMPGKMRRGI